MFLPPHSNHSEDWMNYQEAQRINRTVNNMQLNQGPSAIEYAVANQFVKNHPGFASVYIFFKVLFSIIGFVLCILVFCALFVSPETIESMHLTWLVEPFYTFFESIRHMLAPDLFNQPPTTPVLDSQSIVSQCLSNVL